MQWLAIVGSVGMVVSVFLPWYVIGAQLDIFSYPGFTGLGLGVGLLGLVALIVNFIGKDRRYALVGLGTGAIGLLLTIVAMFNMPEINPEIETYSALGIGIYLSVVFCIVTIAGFYLRFRKAQTA